MEKFQKRYASKKFDKMRLGESVALWHEHCLVSKRVSGKWWHLLWTARRESRCRNVEDKEVHT